MQQYSFTRDSINDTTNQVSKINAHNEATIVIHQYHILTGPNNQEIVSMIQLVKLAKSGQVTR
jgi:hypothetical protein